MNKDRRKRLEKIREEIDTLMSQVEEIADEEQYAFDSLPYQFAESDRGQAMQEAIECLNNAATNLYETSTEIGRAIGEV